MVWGTVILGVARILYSHGLRDVVEKLVEDPDEKYDEFFLELLDAFLKTK